MSSQFSATIGNNIKKYRKAKGMTLKELGTKINRSEATTQKYEAGHIEKVSVELLIAIADALDVLPEYLIEWRHVKHKEGELNADEIQLINTYNQLTHGHKEVVITLANNLLKCQ